MSEHQYYEFQTLDRPLTAREQRELRAISSHATITPTRFANTYDWGDLKAEPAKLVERYFDAHLYVANWGTRALTLRFPKRLLDVATARRYCPGGAARARASNDHVIIDLRSEEEPPEWIDDDQDTGRLGALLSLRGDSGGGAGPPRSARLR